MLFSDIVTVNNPWEMMVIIMPGVLACIASVVASILGYMNHAKIVENTIRTDQAASKVEALDIKVDGRLSKLLELTTTSEHAKGVLQGVLQGVQQEQDIAARISSAEMLVSPLGPPMPIIAEVQAEMLAATKTTADAAVRIADVVVAAVPLNHEKEEQKGKKT